MIFGESKSGAALNPAERTKLRAFAGKTGSYLCFCTLAEDFSEDDKTFFRELVEAKIGVIMLNRFFLEMAYFELLKFRMRIDGAEQAYGRYARYDDSHARKRVRYEAQHLALGAIVAHRKLREYSSHCTP